MSDLTENEEYLSEEIAALRAQLVRQRDHLNTARATVEQLEQVVHKAAQIAQHLPYLCSTLPEHSPEIEQAAFQLQTLLVQRKP